MEDRSLMKKDPKSQINPKDQLPTLEQLLEAGAHFGHQSKRWHPKIAPYLYKEINKINIFDLNQTYLKLGEAVKFLRRAAAEGKTVCFVGTKRQAAAIVKREAERAGAFYIDIRWTGGMMTNFDHVRHKMERLEQIEQGLRLGGRYETYTKKERLDLEREAQKLVKEVGGVRAMERVPDILYVVDLKREATAVAEARKKNIAVVAIVDSNCDPTQVDYPIPANDDAIKAIELITQTLASAIISGRDQNAKVKDQNQELGEVKKAGKKVEKKKLVRKKTEKKLKKKINKK